MSLEGLCCARHLFRECFLAVAILAVATSTPVMGQDGNAPAEEVKPLGSYLRFYRWAEDYSHISDEVRDASFFGPLKRIQLGEDIYPNLSFGGEYRVRYERHSQRNFGIQTPTSTDSILQRLLLHTDLRFSERIRGFVQLGLYEESGSDLGPRPLDESEVDLQQGFVEYGAPEFTARVGRQELSLGSGKYTGAREGPDQRRAFDAARFTLRAESPTSIDVFYGREVQPKVGAFEDDTSGAPEFWGIYGNKLFSVGGYAADSYYLGFGRDGARFDQGVANETRHTVGARLSGEVNRWILDVEGAYQFGRFGSGDISAYGASADVSYRSSSSLGLTPGLYLAAASGDKNRNDEDLGTFSALFPTLNRNYESTLYRPRNAFEVFPNVQMQIADNLKVRVGVDFLWKHSTGDALYAGPGFPLLAGDGSDSRYVGNLQSVEVAWKPESHISVFASFIHADAGTVVSDGGGEDTDFLMLSMAIRF